MQYVAQARQPLVTFVADPDADWHRFIIDPARELGNGSP
jgi:hypothetical protein